MDKSIQRLRMRRMGLKGENLPDKLTRLEKDKFPAFPDRMLPDECYVSRHFMVQVFYEDNPDYVGLIRLSVNRTKANASGWLENITWEELQGIKAELGYSERYAIEVYPPDKNVVNVANMRHLWVLQTPLNIGWLGKKA